MMFRAGLCVLMLAVSLPGAMARASDELTDLLTPPADHLAMKIAGEKDAWQSLFDAGRKPVVAVWPFDRDRISVNVNWANRMAILLAGKLVDRADGAFTVKAKQELDRLIDHLKLSGGLKRAGGNKLAALMEQDRSINVLIEGHIEPAGDRNNTVEVVFRAVGDNGSLIASTDPVRVRLSRAQANSDGHSLSLEQAVEDAARSIVNQAHGMRSLSVGGLHFQTSGAQTEFSRYFMETVSLEIADKFANPLTSKALKLNDIGVRGLDVEGVDLSDATAAADAGDYVLTGTYWKLGDVIDVRLKAQNRSNMTASWRKRIRTDVLDHLAYVPGTDHSRQKTGDNAGPIGFSVTSAHGKDPSYRIGETMELLVKLSQDAYVYCYYTQADGRTLQIFPNPHVWARANSPLLTGGGAGHVIPSGDTANFRFRVRPPTGNELIKCFATDRDVTEQLPVAMQGRSLNDLPLELATNLARVFDDLPDVRKTETSLSVTITKKSRFR